MTINPFHYGKPVPRADRFVGRRREVDHIVNRLLNAAFESTSVVGERRIGKTSLLRHLFDPVVVRRMGFSDRYCFVYISFEGLGNISPGRFWHWLLSEIRAAVGPDAFSSRIDAVLKTEEVDFFDVRALFSALAQAGWYIVLLLDEFEYIVQNTSLDATFYGALRHLASNYKLALVTASRRELIHYCHSEEIRGSPFFNIFANVVLRVFSSEEARDLISRYTIDSPVSFTEDDIRYAIYLGGCHPYFLQLACYFVFDAHCKQEYGRDDRQRRRYIEKCFDDNAFPHFAYYWAASSYQEKITLAALAYRTDQAPDAAAASADSLRRLVPGAGTALDSLAKRGLVVEAGGGYRLFSPRFHWWIVNEVTARGIPEDPRTRRLPSCEYKIAVVRHLIKDAFTPETLWRFCQERSIFRPILDNVRNHASLENMADVVIEYCRTQDLFSELLLEISAHNPRQYAKYDPYLRRSGD
jgi:hypothetical protein